ncbi:uncharacterized protein EV420DRAFT_1651458 [Desarmillaria tabescens]|uniref:F-box domain-containing protein n=1 Tax=Armillaria tabescens TaxID=1929756 RepID=A0AA39JCW2_ARMTA|nr:uncharacterized protein EV420DRAFT_1651458 [Desarmillaria tabescens]KAK0438313.1 hypothetical protein EV420DRAFT_1651458 [Desarmillaria tabescens]
MSSVYNMNGLELVQSNQGHPPAKDYINNLPEELLEIFAFGALSTRDTAFSFRVSTTCRLWRFFAVNEAHLWTSLTITGHAARFIPEPSRDDPLETAQTVFPREDLILEPSADSDIDLEILLDSQPPRFIPGELWVPYSLTDDHFLRLSCLLTSHAHHIRSFFATVRSCFLLTYLCYELRWTVMPRLKKWELSCSRDVAYKECFDNEICKIAPVQLCLAYQPQDKRPSMETLRDILSNNMHTLESLELACVVDLDSPPTAFRLDLPHIRSLALGYISPQEVQLVLQAFAFPAICKLTIQPHGESKGTVYVFYNLMKYLPLNQLQA